jgi:hypothetical protein
MCLCAFYVVFFATRRHIEKCEPMNRLVLNFTFRILMCLCAFYVVFFATRRHIEKCEPMNRLVLNFTFRILMCLCAYVPSMWYFLPHRRHIEKTLCVLWFIFLSSVARV